MNVQQRNVRDDLLFNGVHINEVLCNYNDNSSMQNTRALIPTAPSLSLAVYADLWKTGMFERMSLQTDEDEHSIEMHLPYTAKAMER